MSDFTPKTRLEKILCGVTGAAAKAKTRLEKAVAVAVVNAGSGGGGSGDADRSAVFVTLEENEGVLTASVFVEDIVAAAATRPVYLRYNGSIILVEQAIDTGEALYVSASMFGVNEFGVLVETSISGHRIAGETDAWAVGYKFASDPAPLQVDMTMSEGTITLDKTAGEVFAAAQQGRMVEASAEMPGDDITVIIPIEAFKISGNGGDLYIFKARADSNAADHLYMSAALSESDTVVLTEVAGE